MRFDLIIRGGKVVNSSGLQKLDIGINDGVISVLALPGCLPANISQRKIDATGKLIIPGVVDSHVHLREPGFTRKEDFSTGTKAAAAGGVTTIMVMPFTCPFVISSKELNVKAHIAAGRANVDYSFQAAINPSNLKQIMSAVKWGVASFEILLAEAPEEISIRDNGILLSILEQISVVKSIVGIYADDDSIIKKYSKALKASGRCDFMAHYESKPHVGEALGISRACLVAESVGARIHFRQISTKIGVDILRKMKQRYDKISAEASPHHIFLDTNIMNSLGPFAKVNPPLRKREDCDALWEGLRDGTIDIIASDHAPHTQEEKEIGYKDIWRAPAGIIGVQTLLPLFIDQALSGFLSLEELVRLLCETPAKLFGFYPRKGIIEVGSDADIVIIDSEKKQIVTAASQYSKAKRTPFEGRKLKGKIDLTLLRGNIIMEDGIVMEKPLGQLIKPTYK